MQSAERSAMAMSDCLPIPTAFNAWFASSPNRLGKWLMIHPHFIATDCLDHQSALFTPRNDRVYSHYFIAGQKFKLELRIPGAEFDQMWREYQTREERIDIYVQPASDSLGRAGRKYCGFFDAVEVWEHALVKARPLIR
jgi:hypothetical protein